jgi:hypothetical protein
VARLISPRPQDADRLTRSGADDRWPRVAPDGSQIAFVSNRDGNPEIYPMALDGGSQTRLTTSTGRDEAPIWSMASQLIVFTSDRDGDREIWKINRDGGGLVQLTNNESDDTYAVWGRNTNSTEEVASSYRKGKSAPRWTLSREETSMKRVLCAALIMLLGLFLAPQAATVRADDTALGTVGYGVVPLDNNQVTMTGERVEAEIRGEVAWVACTFTFVNSGPAADILMGFPQGRSNREGEPPPPLLEFRASVDGVAAAVTFRPQARPQGDMDYAGWYAFNVHFAAGQTRRIQNSYHGPLTVDSMGGKTFLYVLRTGATWKGSIGQADIVVRWRSEREVNPNTLSAQPDGAFWGQRELRWRFTDLEPTNEDNISVHFYAFAGPNNVAWTAAASSGLDQPSAAPGIPFADDNPLTAWQSAGESSGAWIAWSSGGQSDYASQTLGIGILPGAPGKAYRDHGRPKDVLVRLAHVRAGVEVPFPFVFPSTEEVFLNPPAELTITEHRLHLVDAPRWQFLRLSQPTPAVGFQVLIEQVYPGERYDDVAIAEVRYPLLAEDLTVPSGLPSTAGDMPAGWVMALIGVLLLLAGWGMRIRNRIRAHAGAR